MKFNLISVIFLLQIHFRIPPVGQYQLTYNLFPLIPGHVGLPKLHLSLSQGGGGTAAGDSMDEVLQKLMPSHIFIKVFIHFCLIINIWYLMDVILINGCVGSITLMALTENLPS